MIGKLKRKFTILATVSMLVLMAVLVLIMNIVNYSSVAKESDNVLDVLSQPNAPFSDGKTPPEKPDKRMTDFIPPGMSPEVPYESRYFTVTVTESGEIEKSNLSRIISVDEDEVKEYIDKAILSNKSRGFIGHFRYLKQGENGGRTKITFLDCGRKLDAFYTFLWTSLAVGLLGCVIVFIVFLFVSGKIVKPIAESYEKQKRFISDAGHEIKTPLTIINANVDLLSLESDKEEIDEIRSQTKRLTELTNNLVYLSKMEESEHKIQKTDFPLSDLVAETVYSFQALATCSSVALSWQIEPNITLNGSPDAVRQLVSILLENAVKYSPVNGVVDLSLSSNRKAAVLSVFNQTRETVNAADLPYVFERFYRTDASRNSATGGHGIGLSIAKAIAGAHGGNITASTETGSDFTVRVTVPL